MCRVRPVIAGASVLLLGAAAGCGPDRGAGVDTPRCVVLVVIDTLRGDRIGCNGYGPAATPTLDSLAASGVLFRDANTPVPVTLPAVASLLTGRYPFAHRVRDNGFFSLAPEFETLAERFHAAGWRTGAVVASAVLERGQGLAQGFEVFDDDFRGPYPVYDPKLRSRADEYARTRRRADDVTGRALAIARGWADERAFLLVHYFDVHMELDPPPRYAERHPGRPYDAEVEFVDAEIGRLLAGLPNAEDALVVIVADHGESQWEHGEPAHGFFLYQSTIGIPLIVSGPGVPDGVTREDPVSLVDLEPTIAAAVDLPSDGTARDGRVLRWAEPERESVLLYAESFRPLVSYEWSELRAVRRGSDKLIRGPYDERYDLANDPREETDLGSGPVARELATEMDALVGEDPAARVWAEARSAESPQSRELLESLGYLGIDVRAAESLPVQRPHPRDALPRWIDVQKAKALTREAAPLISAGRWQEAFARLDSAIVLAPRLVNSWAARGWAHQCRGDTSAAEADYARALAVDPDHVGTLVMAARLAEARRDDETALARWTEVHRIDRAVAEASIWLADWHYLRGEPEQAAPYVRRLVASDPAVATGQADLVEAARRAGRVGQTIGVLRAFLKTDPGEPDAGRAQAWLEALEAERG